MIKEVIGTMTLIILNNLGLILVLNKEGFLYYLGYINYTISILVLYFIVTKYMEGDFYKNLEKDKQ